MLQRVQTYYLGLIIGIQVIAISGMDFIQFTTADFRYGLNAWGMQQYAGEAIIGTATIPVFIGFIVLTLVAFLCILSYKKLDRQLKLGRTLFYLYFLEALSVYLIAVFGESLVGEEVLSQEVGLPYWIFICGLPLSFLANAGIKRDKRLLDSLKRL